MATVTSAAAPAAAPAATGHPTAFWFFFWGEFAERCSYYGMRAILALYMVDKLGVEKGDAGTYMSLFIAACYFFPLIGGFVADNFLGKYWTIVLFSVPYVVAQFLVGVENKYVVLGALTLLAMGSGVIKPNISTLMGMTYDAQRPGQTQLRTSAFSWFYMAINIGAFLSQLVMPRLRTGYGYQAAFLFPAALMAMALVVFALGKRFYPAEAIRRKLTEGDIVPPAGRTVTGLPVSYDVLTADQFAADRKAKFDTLGRIGAVFLTVMFFWAIFDQSASTWIFFADTYMNCTLFGYPAPADSIQAFNALFIVLLVPVSVYLFKLFPVRPTTKMMLGFLLTGLSMVIMAAAGFQAGTKTEKLKLTTPEGALVLPYDGAKLDAFGAAPAAAFGGVTATDWKYNEQSKKLEFTAGILALPGTDRVVKIAAGHAETAEPEVYTTSGVAETLMKSGDELAAVKPGPATATLEVVDWVPPADRVTVWWQVLAFLIITVAEILVSVTGLELAFVAAPASMKSFVTACWLAVVFLANLLINAPITQLYPKLAPGVYFAGLAGAMAVVTLVFLPIAARFNRAVAPTPAV